MSNGSRVNVQAFVFGLVGLVAIAVLIALGKVSADVGVPIISGVTLGGIGHANGYAQGQKAP